MKRKKSTSPSPAIRFEDEQTVAPGPALTEHPPEENGEPASTHPHNPEPVEIRLVESPFDIWCIRIGNICVTVAAVLFLISLLPEESVSLKYVLRGIGYFFGAVAYGSEIFALTDGFKEKLKFGAMYMPYVFGVLYILLGISYVMH